MSKTLSALPETTVAQDSDWTIVSSGDTPDTLQRVRLDALRSVFNPLSQWTLVGPSLLTYEIQVGEQVLAVSDEGAVPLVLPAPPRPTDTVVVLPVGNDVTVADDYPINGSTDPLALEDGIRYAFTFLSEDRGWLAYFFKPSQAAPASGGLGAGHAAYVPFTSSVPAMAASYPAQKLGVKHSRFYAAIYSLPARSAHNPSGNFGGARSAEAIQ